MLEVNKVSHDYEGKGKRVVEDISFEIDKGEIFGFLGPSGAGKKVLE